MAPPPGYPDPPASGPFIVGGGGGAPYVGYKATQGLLVKRIGIWKTPFNFSGLEITYTDNSIGGPWGTKRTEYSELILQPGEKITELTLWGDGFGTRTGRVKILTNTGRTWDWGKNTDGQTAYPCPVHSGLLAGVAGYAGSEIDALGFIFLDGVSSVALTQVTYPDLPPSNFQPVAFDRAVFTNGTNDPDKEYNYSKEISTTTTSSWNLTTSTSYGIDISVEASVFDIVKVGTSFSWNKTEESSHGMENSDTNTSTYQTSGKYGTNKTITIVVTAQRGSFNIKFNGVIVVNFDSGLSYRYNVSGTFNNVAYTAGTIDVS